MTNQHYQIFEEIRQYTADGHEFWSARDLARVLQYSEYRHFVPVIEKAKKACKNSNKPLKDHFEEILEMVKIGSNAKRSVLNYHLSQYGCYLIIQNAGPLKEIVANGQTYFAIQTRRQELADNQAFQQLDEDKKRVFLRNELREHNKQLVETASQAGVESPKKSKLNLQNNPSPVGRHCEARSAVAIQEDLYGLPRRYAPRNDGSQGKKNHRESLCVIFLSIFQHNTNHHPKYDHDMPEELLLAKISVKALEKRNYPSIYEYRKAQIEMQVVGKFELKKRSLHQVNEHFSGKICPQDAPNMGFC